MKIYFVSSLYWPVTVGGAEQSLQTLAEAMVAMGHSVVVNTLTPRDSELATDEIHRGVHIRRTPLANLYWPWHANVERTSVAKAIWHSIDANNPVMTRHLAQHIRTIDPDIIVTTNLQGWSTAGIPKLIDLGYPVIHTINDYSLVCPQTSLFRDGSRCGMQTKRCLSCKVLSVQKRVHTQGVHGVVGVSQSVLDFHTAHGLFAHTSSNVIYNPLKPDLDVGHTPRQSPSTPFCFGYLGRVEKQKGIETLLQAVAILREQSNSFRVVVAGNAPDPSYLDRINQTWSMPEVEFVGFTPASTLLEKLDCLIFPTLGLEALGNSVFEAFSRGLPVIGSDAGGIPETINHGENGFVFNRNDPHALAHYMQRIMQADDAYRVLSTAALRKAHEYLPPKRAREHIDFYRQIVRHHYAAARADTVEIDG
ncbi:MAG: glycosyltransferase family 4 protein [Pseudomonadota bacterium]